MLVGRDSGQVSATTQKPSWDESAAKRRPVIARCDIDTLDICASGWMHAEIALAAIEADKACLRGEAAGARAGPVRRHGGRCHGAVKRPQVTSSAGIDFTHQMWAF